MAKLRDLMLLIEDRPLPPEQKRRQGQSRLLMRRYLAQQVPSGLFNAHKKCGDILPGTLPKCQQLYKKGKLFFFA